MRRLLCLLLAAAAAVAAPPALAWAGKPRPAPPKRPTAVGPPPAWIESRTRSSWLAYGGYCWRTTCVTPIPPAQRSDIPAFRVARGATVRVHLGFTPTSVTVRVGDAAVPARRRGAVVTWRTLRAGLATVSAKGAGSASYLVRLRLA